MTKNYENPNNAAFFFDDGDFVNLEDVVAVFWQELGDDRHRGPLMNIRLRGGNDFVLRSGQYASAEQRQRLTDALRIYHSKF